MIHSRGCWKDPAGVPAKPILHKKQFHHFGFGHTHRIFGYSLFLRFVLLPET